MPAGMGFGDSASFFLSHFYSIRLRYMCTPRTDSCGFWIEYFFHKQGVAWCKKRDSAVLAFELASTAEPSLLATYAAPGSEKTTRICTENKTGQDQKAGFHLWGMRYGLVPTTQMDAPP